MDKILRPEKLDLDTTTPDAEAIYKFWEKTLRNLVTTSFDDKTEVQKLSILTQYLTYKTYPIIEDATTYTEALKLLKDQFYKTKNEVYARHILYTRKQKSEETVDEFLTVLRQLAKDCNYQQVSAKDHQDQSIRDSFISGLKSPSIRQRILEESVTLQQAWEKARSMETAQKNAESYHLTAYTASTTSKDSYQSPKQPETVEKYEYTTNITAVSTVKCWNCGRPRHQSRQQCPAREATCFKCNRTGHYAKYCRGGAPPKKVTNAAIIYRDTDFPVLATIDGDHGLKKSIAGVYVDGKVAQGLRQW